jgi:hypothetical protein
MIGPAPIHCPLWQEEIVDREKLCEDLQLNYRLGDSVERLGPVNVVLIRKCGNMNVKEMRTLRKVHIPLFPTADTRCRSDSVSCSPAVWVPRQNSQNEFWNPLFKHNFFVQLDTWFTYLVWTVFSVVCSVFCIFLWHCTTPFFLCIVLFIFLVLYCFCLWCTCCYTNWRFSVHFSSVVRQIPGYNSQRIGTARTSQISLKFFGWFVCSVLRILCTVCV